MDFKKTLQNVSTKTEFLAILLFTICHQLFFATSISPFFPFEGTDSLVFKQMGLLIIQGGTPYIDIFDHKGPVIYFVDALAQWLAPGRMGLFAFQVLNLAVTTCLWYQTCLLFVTKRRHAIVPILIGILSFLAVEEDGNLTEDWSMLPVSYAIYLYARYCRRNEAIGSRQFFVVGLGMGCLAFMRVNNMAVVCCMLLSYGILLLCRRAFRDFSAMCIACIGGIAAVALPVLLFFFCAYGSQGVCEMLNGTFLFNFKYMGSGYAVNNWLMYTVRYGRIAVILSALLLYRFGFNRLTLFTFFSLLATFVAIGDKGWCNYYLLFAPVMMLAAAQLCRKVSKLWIAAILLLLVWMMPPGVARIRTYIFNPDDVCFYEDTHGILSAIPEEERNSIWNDASFAGLAVLHKENITQCNRVILGFQKEISALLKESESKRFCERPPMWVISSSAEFKPTDICSRSLSKYAIMHKVVTKDNDGNPIGYMYFYKKTN